MIVVGELAYSWSVFSHIFYHTFNCIFNHIFNCIFNYIFQDALMAFKEKLAEQLAMIEAAQAQTG